MEKLLEQGPIIVGLLALQISTQCIFPADAREDTGALDGVRGRRGFSFTELTNRLGKSTPRRSIDKSHILQDGNICAGFLLSMQDRSPKDWHDDFGTDHAHPDAFEQPRYNMTLRRSGSWYDGESQD